MKKIFSFVLLLLTLCLCLGSCHSVSPNADEEAVLVEKPWLWGHGGVDMTAVESGLEWCWFSTHGIYFKIVPVKHQVRELGDIKKISRYLQRPLRTSGIEEEGNKDTHS